MTELWQNPVLDTGNMPRPTPPRPPLAETLDLDPHPEGGWYRQTWASPVSVTLPDGRERPTATLIYFLLPAGESSSWHRVASDELWLAHTGEVRLELGGPGPAPGRPTDVVVDASRPQAHVPAGVWQRTVPGLSDALVSCLVSPGFHFEDFELDGGPRS
jgi:predicted cupin superfamily sugar epimerase